MSLSAIRTQIKTNISAVSGIGKVHDYKRLVTNWERYKDEFIKNDKINTWEIILKTFEKDVMGSDATERTTYNFEITGRYAVDDSLASEKTFHNLSELVARDFRNKPKLNDTAEVVNYPITCDFTEEKYGGVLCHRADIKVSIRERVVFG